MAMGQMDLNLEQRCVMKFLVSEGVSSSEIYRRLLAVFKEYTLSKSRVFEWCARFREGRQSVLDDFRPGAPRAAVTDENIRRVEALILANRLVTTREISLLVGISHGSVETIIHEHLEFNRQSAGWEIKPTQKDESHKISPKNDQKKKKRARSR